ncbi:hypothetical protein SAY87_009104 [Trapa incisa]|uniref:Uncharacterized protein n=1 Tax=Trapa incisa TaxID=236973 RepID=A0AAN7JY68_9MYRT|nr:hypothetical protein SAY87_009104 [Trapa incisa]
MADPSLSLLLLARNEPYSWPELDHDGDLKYSLQLGCVPALASGDVISRRSLSRRQEGQTPGSWRRIGCLEQPESDGASEKLSIRCSWRLPAPPAWIYIEI